MILMIDNYDSFTWNLVHLIGGLGFEVVVERNDRLTAEQAMARQADAIVLSPGPCTPDQAGICLELVTRCAKANVPLFGVCLGLQAIAQAFGGQIVRAERLMHGKVSQIDHDASAFLAGLPAPFTATRYHSLIAEPASLPADLSVIARARDDREIMAIAHETAPIGAVQFHPESIASDHGAALFKAFMDWAETRISRHRAEAS